jgi:hypothetical protein
LRYVTLSRSELSRLLFEKINDTAEVIFDNEIVSQNSNGVQAQLKHSGERQFNLVIGAFAPKTRWGLSFRNQVIGAFAIPGWPRFPSAGRSTTTCSFPNMIFGQHH